MRSEVLRVRTGATVVTDLTDDVVAFAREGDGAGATDGLVHVFVPHATAGVAVLETGAGSEADLERALELLLPRDDGWVHRHGSPGHGRDHVLPAFVAPSLSVPVLVGRPQLGTWQSVVLVDTNADNPHRQVRLSFLAG